MKREYKSYLIRLGNIVYQERQKLGMSQIAFYKFLFPDTNKEDENIKKKMNAIENAKISNIDYEFIFTLCNACNLSIEYIFENQTNYKNHENELICNYTGLEENAVEILHEYQLAKQSSVNLSIIKDGGVGEEADQIEDAFYKNTAINMLSTINYLFRSRAAKDYPEINEDFSDETNLSIIYFLYQYCIGQPEALCGVVTGKNALEIDPLNQAERLCVEVNLNELALIKDIEEKYYPFRPREVYKEIAKNNLIKSLDQLSKQYEKDTGIIFKGDAIYDEAVLEPKRRRKLKNKKKLR